MLHYFDSSQTETTIYSFLQVLAKVAQQILSIPQVLDKDLPPIKPLFKTFLTTVVDCAKKDAEPWRGEFIQVFDAYANCIIMK